MESGKRSQLRAANNQQLQSIATPNKYYGIQREEVEGRHDPYPTSQQGCRDIEAKEAQPHHFFKNKNKILGKAFVYCVM